MLNKSVKQVVLTAIKKNNYSSAKQAAGLLDNREKQKLIKEIERSEK